MSVFAVAALCLTSCGGGTDQSAGNTFRAHPRKARSAPTASLPIRAVLGGKSQNRKPTLCGAAPVSITIYRYRPTCQSVCGT